MVYYRGSAKLVEEFSPVEINAKDKEKKNIKIDRGVWLTPDWQIALVMGALGGKVGFRMNYNPANRYISFADTDWEHKLNLDEKVYLYSIELQDDNVEIVNQSEVLAKDTVKVSKPEEFTVREVLDNIKIIEEVNPTHSPK